VCSLFRLGRNNRIPDLEKLKHARFDEAYRCRSSVVVYYMRENSRQVPINDFEGRLASGRVDSRIDRKFDGGEVFRPVRTILVDIVAQRLVPLFADDTQ